MELLFEIGAEEIPAGMLPRAAGELRTILEKHFIAENLSEGTAIETFGGPRRLTAWVRGIIAKQADVEMEVTGPPKSMAYDNVGAPTRAAVSFAEKQGVALHELVLVTTPKGESIAARITKRGRTAQELLLEILPRVIHDLSWPRTMTWTGLEGARFIRPIRWIVALLDGKPLKFSFGGVAAGDTTSGHRFLGKPKIRVEGFRGLRKEAARQWRDRPPGRAAEEDHARSGRACQAWRVSRPRRCEPAGAGDLPERISERDRGRLRSRVPRAAGRDPDHRDARPPEILRGGETGRGTGAALPGGDQSGEGYARVWCARGTNACCGRGLRMRGSSGSPIRNVGSPTFYPSCRR